MSKTNATILGYLSALGRKGGQSRSAAKRAASRLNAAKATAARLKRNGKGRR